MTCITLPHVCRRARIVTALTVSAKILRAVGDALSNSQTEQVDRLTVAASAQCTVMRRYQPRRGRRGFQSLDAIGMSVKVGLRAK
jgi:hypothetical protein